MRAEDALRFIAEKLYDQRDGETLATEAVREGIAFDEVSRFMMIGPFLVENVLAEWCMTDHEGNELDEHAVAELLWGRLWLDGFMVGRRMARAEIDAMVDKRLEEALARAIRLREDDPGDVRPSP